MQKNLLRYSEKDEGGIEPWISKDENLATSEKTRKFPSYPML